MTRAEESFLSFLENSAKADIEQGNFFGFQALKFQGKSFVILSGEHLVFRLDEELRIEAIELTGASLWNPFGKEKRNWVQLPSEQFERWKYFFDAAMRLIRKR